MKKIKYRNNNYNNQVYSINYKFDSVSPAGKYCGTALDLIKKYNELAKEAQANGNYVESEVFRQYAEHYRKIVTEINERKNNRFSAPNKETENSDNIAENIVKHLQKGSKIAVVGSIEQRNFLKKDGSQGTKYEVVANSIEFLDSKKPEEQKEEQPKFDPYTGKPISK